MRHRESGFTLLEVLAAVFIMSIAFMALAMTSMGSTRLSSTATEIPAARGALAVQLSQLQQQGYRTLNQCSATSTCTGTATNGIHQLSWTIVQDSPTNPSARVGFVRVNVTVSWTKAGSTRTFSTSQLVTCLEDPGGTATNPYPECPA